ncbi:MAG: hypothetical protein DDG60_00835 [Anaerolineae bacterium]|nr:MAG: hypothetical protein DDG60_00835 [Anaerolineae bacterium]
MPDISARVSFLKQSHLFRGVNDKDLAAVAEIMQESAYGAGETIFTEGTPADSFYMIYRGRVRLSRRQKDRSIHVATLFPGDYFGERGLLKAGIRNATAIADESNTLLLVLYRSEFKKLLSRMPTLWDNFDLMMDSRQLASELNFPWLSDNEVIYFLARKHHVVLWRMLAWPLLGFLFALGVLGLGLVIGPLPSGLPINLILAGVGGFLVVIALAWALWLYLDWSNDFYIVTNQRVIYLEKVIGLYDNRQEAPMSTILSVNTEADYWGRRFFDYGTVIVRTFVGQIRMTFVRHPLQAAAMIEEYWNRTKQVSRKLDEEIIKNSIRAKLGVPKRDLPPPPPMPKPIPAVQKAPVKRFWDKLFPLRQEDGGTVTYHKHWFVLVLHTIPQLGGILAILVVLVAYPFLFGAPPLWLVFILFTLMMGLALWWFYRYEDWKNDLYQVTPDQIIDIYRKPFGTEDRKAAPLDGILSTEYRRNGIIEVLLNYGTVYISVGGTNFDFEDVADPPSVQQDIVRRLQVRLAKKKEADTAAERERMAEWLGYYHKTIQEIEEERRRAREGGIG